MSKKINFFASDIQAYHTEEPPLPAIKKLPDWYKKMSLKIKNTNNFGRSSNTIKACPAFLDAMTAGYMLTIPQDIMISTGDNGEKLAYWQIAKEYPIFDIDGSDRIVGLPIPDGYDNNVWNMVVFPRIETPPGHSVLVTHPMNRFELPFLTLSGVIDTDKHHAGLTISLFLRKNFNGILKKGTPVAQVFPFMRENWDHANNEPYSYEKSIKQDFNLFSTMINSYKKNFRSDITYR